MSSIARRTFLAAGPAGYLVRFISSKAGAGTAAAPVLWPQGTSAGPKGGFDCDNDQQKDPVMSEAIVRLLRTTYEAFSKGDPGPLLSSLSDDIRWYVSGGSPLAGEYVGKNDVLSFFQKMGQLYGGSLKLELSDILASDNHGVVLTREELRYEDRLLSFRSVHLWEVRDGKFSSFHVYYDDAYHKFWPRR
jgi:uncharacterized protein